MRYGSICSGIEAATQAWHALGWEPSFFSEIDAFPRAVLQHHYPGVPLHGDFTTIEDNTYEPIELLVGGTPCQSFSVAGLRAGLGDDRGNLSLEYLRLAARLRPAGWSGRTSPASFRPSAMPRPIHVRRKTLWTWDSTARRWKLKTSTIQKNYTPSTASWPDFQNSGMGSPTVCLTLNTSEHAATPTQSPQRRRRVFVVGYFGDWRPAAAVLFDRESLSGNPPPRREAGQKVTSTINDRPTGGGGLGADFDLESRLVAHDVASTLNASFGDKQGLGKSARQRGLSIVHCLRLQRRGGTDRH